MTRQMRWVAPPNWPEMPQGFEPPDGWQPDPSWEAPPDGWQFWQPVRLDVNTGLPWYRKISNPQLGWIIGGVLIIAAVTSAVVTSIGASHPTERINASQLDRQLEHWMKTQLGSVAATVDCPTGEEAKKGNEFICTAGDSSGTAHIDVTVINNDGELRWQVVG